MYLPTSGFARAFTLSAWALFHVNFGSSKYPETCSTKTSFSFSLAIFAASDGLPAHAVSRYKGV